MATIGNKSDGDNGEMDVNFSWVCQSCGIVLEPPWVRCAVCRPALNLCSSCFCYGVEFGNHESDHAYSVVKFDFPLYEASWTAAEEIQLLEAVQEYGLGNWSAISGKMRVKSASECEAHYFRCYVDNPQPPLPAISGKMRVKSASECEAHYFRCYVDNPQPPLPDFPDPENNNKGAPVIFKLSDNPPRPPENSTLWSEMAGYSAARADFSDEFDNFIEIEIGEIDFLEEDTDTEGESSDDNASAVVAAQERAETRNILSALKFAVIDVYRNCLVERQRRKR
ncbi:transcriptional adapter 2-alpha-like [Elysia marginata]|uniref:Transcriptional adapter 2-alpha-like n=1 Tax=Elysia marginata TaxID=1093978 RepID=A0AAV4EMG2_9GAST|nr:transcriptional adapter 2-alpha-like [Elysia marginata]